MPDGMLFLSDRDMSEEQREWYRKRAKGGDYFELKGAFGDRVYVPKHKSDVDPGQARRRNRMRLRDVKEIIRLSKPGRTERA